MEFFLFLVLKMNELHKLSTFFILLRSRLFVFFF